MLITTAIDWTKETVTLLTTSGKEHYPCPVDQASAHKVMIEQQWDPRGYEVADRGDYLSITAFALPYYNICSKVECYKNHLRKNGSLNLQNIPLWYYSVDKTLIQRQIRIYKDKTAVLVTEVEDPDDKHHYFMVGDDVALLKNRYGRTILSKTHPDYQKMMDTLKPVIVTTDEEVKAHAQKITNERKNAYLKNYLTYKDSDLATGRIQYISTMAGVRYRLAASTQDAVNNFFEVEDEKNKGFLAEFTKKTKYTKIVDVTDIFTWCQCKDKPTATTDTKQTKIEHYLNIFKAEIGAADQYKKNVVWHRDGDEISACLLYGTSVWSPSVILSVNVATQKKTFIEFHCEADGSVSRPTLRIPDPSEMQIDPRDGNGKKRTNIYHNGLTVDEIFKGTGLIELAQRNQNWYADSYNEEYTYDCIKSDRCCRTFVSMFVLLGVPVANVLKDNQLDNLYYHYIHTPSRFVETDKNGLTKDGGRSLNYGLLLCRPGSTIEEIFGLSVDQLRVVNDMTPRDARKETWSGIARLQCYLPKQMRQVDPDTLKRMCFRIGAINDAASRPIFNQSLEYLVENDLDKSMENVFYYIFKYVETTMGADAESAAQRYYNKYITYFKYLDRRLRAQQAGVAAAAHLPLFPDGSTRSIRWPYVCEHNVNQFLGLPNAYEDAERYKELKQQHEVTMDNVTALQEADIISETVPFNGYSTTYPRKFTELYDAPTHLVFYEPTSCRMIDDAMTAMGYNPTLVLAAITNQRRGLIEEKEATHCVFVRKDGTHKPFLMMEVQGDEIQVIRGPGFKELKDFKAQNILARAIVDWAADFKISYAKVIPITMLINL